MQSNILAALSDLFLKIFNMSMAAVWIILAVILLRLLLKRAPKIIICVLWAFVGIRLICPFSFESFLSLIPSSRLINPNITYSINRAVDTGVPAINRKINSFLLLSDALNPLQIIISIISIIWLAGIIAMLIFALISFLRLRRKIAMTAPYKDNILLCDAVKSPFILGIFRPKIYLPSTMSEEQISYVLAHEKAHLLRKDNWWKPLAYFILALHWFNPLCWVGYMLLCKDIELACDEKVIKKLSFEERRQYSQALLDCSTNRRTTAVCPLAFGEVGVKARIKNVLSYKRPAFWIIITAVVACIAVAVCLLTNPKIINPHANSIVDVLESGSTCDGIGIKVMSASVEKGEVYLDVVWDNQTDYTVGFGTRFWLYKYEDNEWKRLNSYENTAFTNELYLLLPHDTGEYTRDFSYNPTFCYDLSDAGKYRLVSQFSFEDYDRNNKYPEFYYQQHHIYIDFELR